MPSTKERILNVARELFNEFGYSQVTIRAIALKLEMSSGNLNYHFKKREEILEALYFQMVQEFDQRLENFPKVVISFEQIKNDIQMSMLRMVEYSFFWTDLYNLLKANDTIFAHFSKVYQERIKGYMLLFERLFEMGLMRLEAFEKEYEMLSERMVNFSDTWIYNSAIYRRKNTNDRIKSQSNTLLAMLYPYLTENGRQEYLKVTLKD